MKLRVRHESDTGPVPAGEAASQIVGSNNVSLGNAIITNEYHANIVTHLRVGHFSTHAPTAHLPLENVEVHRSAHDDVSSYFPSLLLLLLLCMLLRCWVCSLLFSSPTTTASRQPYATHRTVVADSCGGSSSGKVYLFPPIYALANEN